MERFCTNGINAILGRNLPRDGTGRDTMSFRPENYLQTRGEADLAKTTQ